MNHPESELIDIHVLFHTIEITIIVFLMMVIIDWIDVQTRGKIPQWINKHKAYQYLIACLLGLTPGCMGAYMNVSLYMHGYLSLGAIVGGMIATSGEASLVMFALFPGKAFIINILLLMIALVSAFITDYLLKQFKIEHKYSEQAQSIIQTVAKITQSELQYHISELCSLALSAVFDDPYELQLEFVIRRGKTEADIYFLRNGEKIDPITASGGGAVDIASFALRVALWSLARPRTRNVMILDEPLRFISNNLQERASIMLKELSRKLNLQMIIITHEKNLTTCADRIFSVNKSKQYSVVEIIQ